MTDQTREALEHLLSITALSQVSVTALQSWQGAARAVLEKTSSAPSKRATAKADDSEATS